MKVFCRYGHKVILNNYIHISMLSAAARFQFCFTSFTGLRLIRWIKLNLDSLIPSTLNIVVFSAGTHNSTPLGGRTHRGPHAERYKALDFHFDG